MTVSAAVDLLDLAAYARELREATARHAHDERIFRVTFTRQALAAGKDWDWIARQLEMTRKAAQDFYKRNEKRIGPAELVETERRYLRLQGKLRI